MSPAQLARPSLGIIGIGAFGRLMAAHLRPWFDLYAYDPAAAELPDGVEPANLPTVAGCAVVVLATPVSQFESVIRQIRPHLTPRTRMSRSSPPIRCSGRKAPVMDLQASRSPSARCAAAKEGASPPFFARPSA